MDERANLFERAKLADSTERYEDMSALLKKVIESYPEVPLKDEERNTFSVAYKNRVGALRASCRCLSVAKTERLDLLKEYKATVVKELKEVCDEVLSLLTNHLIKTAEDVNSSVFYLKMKGDYHRYKAEVLVDLEDKVLEGCEAEHEEVLKRAQAAYEEAQEACKELNLLDAVKLGLTLNYSVFLYEIARQKSKACALAKETYANAVEELKNNDKENPQDSTLILQLLRDNFTFWTSAENQQEQNDQEQNDQEEQQEGEGAEES